MVTTNAVKAYLLPPFCQSMGCALCTGKGGMTFLLPDYSTTGVVLNTTFSNKQAAFSQVVMLHSPDNSFTIQ